MGSVSKVDWVPVLVGVLWLMAGCVLVGVFYDCIVSNMMHLSVNKDVLSCMPAGYISIPS
jgi:uncharacterized membrane protein AbrB (regulator of aidB expression)